MLISEYTYRNHNGSILAYHLIIPVKYRRVIFDPEVEMRILKTICQNIKERYERRFLKSRVNANHAYFLI
jgi:putative transposase